MSRTADSDVLSGQFSYLLGFQPLSGRLISLGPFETRRIDSPRNRREVAVFNEQVIYEH